MRRTPKMLMAIVLTVLTLAIPDVCAQQSGFFRGVTPVTPNRGDLRASTTSFYSSVTVNPVLTDEYGVGNSRIMSNIASFDLGLTDWAALTGSIPYNMDLFKQQGKDGYKSGPGDVVLGFRLSGTKESGALRAYSIGSRYSLPEPMGYGDEPLGFRTFSNGEFGWSIDGAVGMYFGPVGSHLSVSYLQYPNAPEAAAANDSDVFYDTGFGYLGIGAFDETGFAESIFQDQLLVSFGTSVPIKSWLTGLAEFQSVTFSGTPDREDIMRLAPGVRIGAPDRLNMSVGMDFGISGAIPDRTVMLKIHIPSFSPRAVGRVVTEEEEELPTNRIRSKNSLVAVADFSTTDPAYQYQDELRSDFQTRLNSLGVLDIIPAESVNRHFIQKELVPVPDSDQRLGVRLGANYLIKTVITDFSIERTSSFNLPLVIGFPKTDFSLTANATVTDLVSGRTIDIGAITATVSKRRGIHWFPTGPTSDLEYLSEPQRRDMERLLSDRWVETFHSLIQQKMDIFGWEPKESEIGGEQDDQG